MSTRPDLRDTIYLDPGDIIAAWAERSGYRFSKHWTDTWQEEHAAAFTVAKVARLDLLTAIRNSLDDVIRNGGTFEQWKANLLPELKKHGWWGVVQDEALTGTPDPVIVNERRLRTIYRTNIRMSMAAGRWRKYQREKELFPYLRYRSDHFRKHPRLDHKSWHGLILRVDDPAWQWLFPPNGWGCNCRVEQVSEARMRRMDWKVDEAPNPPRHDFITAAGEIVSVPQGIAPGFGYNPGTAHLRVLADRATASLTSAIGAGLEGVARQTLRELVAEPAFDQFLALPDPQFPVMILDDMMAGAIGARARVAVLSEQTMEKQLHKRGELSADVYRQLPGLGDRPDVVARDGENVLIVTREESGAWVVAIVKRTASGEGLFVVSVRRQNEASLPRLLRDAEIILDRR
jgi:hypothetical protein